MKNKDTNWGGSRKGAGRKKGSKTAPNKMKAPEDLTQRHTVYFTDEEWKLFRNEGGGKTLRYMIKNGLFKKPAKNKD